MTLRAWALIATVAVSFASGFMVMWSWYVYLSHIWSRRPLSPEALPDSFLWACISAALAILLSPLFFPQLLKVRHVFAALLVGAGYFCTIAVVGILLRTWQIYTDGDILEEIGWMFRWAAEVIWPVPIAGAILGVLVQVLVRNGFQQGAPGDVARPAGEGRG